MEKVLAGAIRREMALEEFCAKQTSEIKHLNRLVCFLLVLPTNSNDYIMLSFLLHFFFLLVTFFFASLCRCNSTSMRENAMPL